MWRSSAEERCRDGDGGKHVVFMERNQSAGLLENREEEEEEVRRRAVTPDQGELMSPSAGQSQ